jgi:hypothetical protein
MSGFSYPKPFEFENAKKQQASQSLSSNSGHGKTASASSTARTTTPNRRAPPVRSKSNDETFFSAGAFPVQRRGPGLGPKTKSGRNLPKPAPSLPVHSSTANKNKLRGRAPPKTRGIGQTQSSNLELMQAARTRSSSLQRRMPSPSEADDVSDTDSPPRKPSSLKAFLTSPMRKNKKVDDVSVQSEQQKSSSLKKFLVSPMRRAPNPKSMDMHLSVGKLDLDADLNNSYAEAKSGGRRTRRQQPPKEDDTKSSKKDKSKPKSFQQLLGKKNPSNNKSEDEFLERKGRKRHNNSSPAISQPSPPQREPSLSPEQEPKKPGSMLTNLLDTIYDSYLDPKAAEDEDDDDGFNALHNSVSRLDMSLSSLF